MKKLSILLVAMSILYSCKQTTTEKVEEVLETPEPEQKEEVVKDRSINFPEEIASVFKAHGGIKTFDDMNTLVFEMEKPDGNEIHTTDLKSRHAHIKSDKFTLGFDGNEAWLEKEEEVEFKRDPRFYHNLMFYFYAMPFVLGDNGITYTKVDPIKADGGTYPGFEISYGEGVGDSPEDNYYIYYDATTHQMKYLGYTVTFFTKEKSKKVKFIEYTDWNEVNGLLLPKTLKWRAYKDGEVGEYLGKDVSFINASASKEKVDVALFAKPVEK